MKKITNFILPLFIILLISFSCNGKPKNEGGKYVVEIIGDRVDLSIVKSIIQEKNVEETQLYQWKNHLVFYSAIKEPEKLSEQLKSELMGVKVKIYEKPFYDFTKSERCKNTTTAGRWKHILLTANLVDDSKMQQEYLNYHKTQFTEWPEIANGFCNADFQQLLLYKNGRQLMLIISIPSNNTLDELNPKTTENNPRVDDWNNIMGKYQEGIPGTEPGEKWVFLEKVK